MSKIVCYPTIYGGAVLADWPHPAVTPDAAWRPMREIGGAKRFPDELAAKCYIATHFPALDVASFIVRDAA